MFGKIIIIKNLIQPMSQLFIISHYFLNRHENSCIAAYINFLNCENSTAAMLESEQMIVMGLVGEQEVGKSSLIARYLRKAFETAYTPTIAVEVSYGFYQCQDGTRMRVKCWDTSGEEKYKGMVCYHLKEANFVIIVYDISDVLSFQKVKDWKQRLLKEAVNADVFYLIGNKTDLLEVDQTLRRVSKEEGAAMAKEINAQFFQVSVKNQKEFDFIADGFEKILNVRAERMMQIKNIATEQQKVLIQSGQLKQGQGVCDCKLF